VPVSRRVPVSIRAFASAASIAVAAVMVIGCGPSEAEQVASAYCERIEAEYARAGMLPAVDADDGAEAFDHDVYFEPPVPDAIAEELILLSGDAQYSDDMQEDQERFVAAAERFADYLETECGFELDTIG
jgi:hypothetical protein